MPEPVNLYELYAGGNLPYFTISKRLSELL